MMTEKKKIYEKDSVTEARNQLAKWETLKSQLNKDNDIDHKTLVDSLEGETNLIEAIGVLVEEITENNMLIKAVDLRISDLNSRKSRYKKKIDDIRTILTMIMDTAELENVTSAIFTASLKETPETLNITDETDLHYSYWVTPEPKLNKKKLINDLKALKEDGKKPEVNGAKLNPKGLTLSIRNI